ncbi:MAG: hypothetical protein CMP48_19620 [Rickettsiales bacterium]|nr:hypothetical protein [Rickettsiales bacterium]
MGNSIYLKALELDKNGQWDAAHELIQDLPDQNAAWIHAYLHRKEGDQWNAEYWYRRAGQPVFTGSLEDEWVHIYSKLQE